MNSHAQAIKQAEKKGIGIKIRKISKRKKSIEEAETHCSKERQQKEEEKKQ